MARLLDILRSTDELDLGQALIRLAKEAASLHRTQDAAARAASQPSLYTTVEHSDEQCRVEGLDPRTAVGDVHASGASLVVKDDDERSRSTLASASRHTEVER